MSNYAIGIDLGTTTSCVTIFRNNSTDIIKVNGERIIESKIYYDIKNGVTSVGKMAERQANRMNQNLQIFGHKNLIIDSRRFIGRYFDDPEILDIYKNYDFEIESNDANEIRFLIKTEDRNFTISPEEASSEILKTLRKAVCTYMSLPDGTDIEAVITVPAYFNVHQRRATSKAAELAKIKVLKLLNEPTAALLNHLYKDIKTNINLLVCYFGATTLDISLINIDGNNNLYVKATSGDYYLGGRNIDEVLFKYLRDTYAESIPNFDKIKKRLETECKLIKEDLSQHEYASSELLSELDINATLTRKLFDELMNDIYKKCLSTIDKCLNKPINIDEILLVGGSSHIPTLQGLIGEKFPKAKLLTPDDRSEIISLGAAIQAAILKNKLTEKYNIHDVINISIGYESFGEEMNFVLKKNATIPCTVVHEAVTMNHNQNSINLNIYEGERKWVRYNSFLGSLAIKNIPQSPRGTIIKIMFNIDISGDLQVTTNLGGKTENQKISLNSAVKPKPMKRLESNIDYQSEDKRFTNWVLIKTGIYYCCQHYMNLPDVSEPIKGSIGQLKKEIINEEFDIYTTEEKIINKVKERLNQINYNPLTKEIEKLFEKV